MVELAETEPGGEGFKMLYPDEMPLRDKVETIAKEIYGAEDVAWGPMTLVRLVLGWRGLGLHRTDPPRLGSSILGS